MITKSSITRRGPKLCETAPLIVLELHAFDFNGSKLFGFSNVFADDQSPYDFCARIGLQVLRELSDPDTESIKIESGNYMFVHTNANERRISLC